MVKVKGCMHATSFLQSFFISEGSHFHISHEYRSYVVFPKTALGYGICCWGDPSDHWWHFPPTVLV